MASRIRPCLRASKREDRLESQSAPADERNVGDNHIVETHIQSAIYRQLRLCFLLTLILAFLFSPAASAQCLRIMPNEELAQSATMICRVRVLKTEKARYEGIYNQLATLQVLEVVNGDTNTKELRVWAQTQTYCANDSYAVGQEMLVFLIRETTFYKTLNYQYGEFAISNETVQGWRDKDKNPANKPYAEVVAEIRTALTQRTVSEFNLVTNTHTIVKVP